MSTIAKICSKLYYLHLGRRLLIPSSQIRYVGETAYFDCNALEDSKWFFQGGLLPNNVVITKYYNWFKTPVHRLTIPKVNLINRGKYTCVIEEDFLEAEGVLHVIGK